MLKKLINYEDFNGETQQEYYYFNLSKSDLMNLQNSEKKGLDVVIKEAAETKNGKKLVDLLQKVVLTAYGIKSEDGKYFTKSKEISAQFKQSAAYDALIDELLNDQTGAASTDFINGILPKDFRQQ